MQFSVLAEYFEKIESTSARLDMTSIFSEMLEKIPANEIDKAIYLSQGQLAPSFEQIEIGMGEKFVMESIRKISGYSRAEVEKKFKELGDLGLVAKELVGKKKQRALYSESLTLQKVHANLHRIAMAGGSGSQEMKIKLLAELLNSANPTEAKFITRIPIGSLRLGVGDQTIMDALALLELEEFSKKNKKLVEELESQLKSKKSEERSEELSKRIRMKVRELIEAKYNIHSDLGSIARMLKEKGLNGLNEIEITPGVPIRPALAERLSSAEEIIEKLGTCAVEAKYDGFRLALHKNGEKVTIFSRHAENVTDMFPEIVEGMRKQVKSKTAILEGEALAFNEETGEFYPFQVTIQRKRKYEIIEKAKEFPLKLFAFDVLFENGKNWMGEPFVERRKQLEKIIQKGPVIELTQSITTNNPKKLNSFFEECIQKGLEGIIAKDLKAPYTTGARKFAWVKLKRSYKGELQDSVDVVILGYFKGRGKRTQFGVGALLTGVFNESSDEFESIAKVGTGLSEDQLTEFKKTLDAIKQSAQPKRVNTELKPDVWVQPYYVIEVRADEITKSPIHTAGKVGEEGFALRFPRMIRLRSDKKAEECTTVKEVKRMFENQKKSAMGSENA